MQVTSPPKKTNGAGPKASKARKRGCLTSDLGKKTASQAKEVGQYAQSQSGIFFKRFTVEQRGQSAPDDVNVPIGNCTFYLLRPRGIPLPLACVNGPLVNQLGYSVNQLG